MLYVLDENVLINAARDIYPPDRIPEIWDWPHEHVVRGHIGTIKRVTDKLKQTSAPGRPEDALSRWIREHAKALRIEDPPADTVQRVLADGYQDQVGENTSTNWAMIRS